jgi:hypothetical protein
MTIKHQHANYRELRLLRRNYDIESKHVSTISLKLAGMVVVGIILLLLCSCSAFASNNVDIAVIAQIESSNNPDAYNKNSGARGLCQITPIVLKEFNKITGKHYTKDDLYIDQVNLLIADWYVNYRIPAMFKRLHIADSVRNRLIAYNWGVGHLKHMVFLLPKETADYIKKYERLS